MLKARPPKIVNGPEILNKFVGASEENIRALFKDAEDEYALSGDDSELHIIIMDEIDAICKARGSTAGGGTGVSDNIVNQLLSKLDGAKTINNILVIGMTNRLDMIDPAILRPGRLEVHIEIGLPNEEGRLQILQIHTGQMNENGYLGSDVSLPTLAAELKNYTGAEIAGICRTAAAYTLKQQINLSDIKSFKVDRSKLRVKMEHFRYAALESKPAFGVKDDELSIYFRNGIINYGPGYEALRSRLDAVVNQVRVSDRTPLMSVLLSGPPGSGRTALAAHLATSCGFPFAKMLTADQLIGFTERGKIDKIHKVFEDAAKTPLGVIILDDLERILSYVDAGPNFSNPMLQALLVMVNKPPKDSGRRVLIVATTSIASKLERLGLSQRFDITIDVPSISEPSAFQAVMQEWADMDPKVAESLSKELPEPIPMKRLLMVLEMARQNSESGEVTSDTFHKCLFDCGYRSIEGIEVK
jgi:vesicle-fusing ATPase